MQALTQAHCKLIGEAEAKVMEAYDNFHNLVKKKPDEQDGAHILGTTLHHAIDQWVRTFTHVVDVAGVKGKTRLMSVPMERHLLISIGSALAYSMGANDNAAMFVNKARPRIEGVTYFQAL